VEHLFQRRSHLLQLLGSAITIAGCKSGGGAVVPTGKGGRALERFGVILNTMTPALKEDPRGTLIALAGMGFQEIEFRDTAGMAIPEWKTIMLDLGLKGVASGGSMHELLNNTDALFDFAYTFETPYVVCYYPWPTGKNEKGLAGFDELAQQLNELGKRAKAVGLRIAYHNHDLEFEKLDGISPYERLLQRTDPSLVTMEMDIYWVKKGGAEPLDLLRRYPGRFELFHVKDMERSPGGERVCLGEGRIDFTELVAAALETPGPRHFIWEREGEHDAQTQLGCARTSSIYLKSLRY
jgi:sugar phosphate isomerase/epimerase